MVNDKYKKKKEPVNFVLTGSRFYKKIKDKYYGVCNCGSKFSVFSSSINYVKRQGEDGKRVVKCRNCQLIMLYGTLIGKKIGTVKVISQVNDKYALKELTRSWHVECDCGGKSVVSTFNLKPNRGDGCSSCNGNFCERRNKPRKKHKFLSGKISRITRACYNTKSEYYKIFGSGVLSICDDWRGSFKRFTKWANKHGFNRGTNIYLKEGEKVYNPANCYVAPKKRFTPYENPQIVPIRTHEKVNVVREVIKVKVIETKKLKKLGIFSRVFKKIKWIISCFDGKAA